MECTFLGKLQFLQCDYLFLIRPAGDNTPGNALDALNMVSPVKDERHDCIYQGACSPTAFFYL